MRENVIKNKSYEFALRIVKLCHNLRNQHEYILSRQLLRSGTSIGANVEEANVAFSKKDFIYKMQIALKEAKESHYWIRLLRDSNYLDEVHAEDILAECNELIYLLVAILKKIEKKRMKSESEGMKSACPPRAERSECVSTEDLSTPGGGEFFIFHFSSLTPIK